MNNIKLKFARVVIAAAFGSLLWAGCAGPRTHYVDATTEVQPVDLTKRHVDTHPERQTGLDASHGGRTIVQSPTIAEGAGAERVP